MEDNLGASVEYEVLNVKKPILSVGRLRLTGHRVYLGADGEPSFIEKNGRKLNVCLKNNVFWLRVRKGLPGQSREGLLHPLETDATDPGSTQRPPGDAPRATTGNVTSHVEEDAIEVKTIGQTVTPSEEERQRHNLTHVPFRNWCGWCLSTKSNDPRHIRIEADKLGVPILMMDFFFFDAKLDPKTATVLCITDCSSDSVAGGHA